MIDKDEFFQREALKQAQQAHQEDEVPIGAVIVSKDQIIAKGHNQTERLQDVTAHAEMIAITSASHGLGSKYLNECTLYVTLEPCLMCATAARWAQLSRLVIGAKDSKSGYSLHGSGVLPAKLPVKKELLADECSELLTEFFKSKRDPY